MQKGYSEISFNEKDIYIGIDVHLKNWKVSIMVEDIYHKTFVQPPDAKHLSKYLVTHFPGGRYHSAYEAGFSGFRTHRELELLGIKSMVANPADIPTTDKEKRQKEDKRDSRKIMRSLKNGDLTAIHVPKDKTLQDRQLLRVRDSIVKDLRRGKQRIKSLLYFQGIGIPEEFSDPNRHWSKNFVNWLQSVELTYASGQNSLKILLDQCLRLREDLLSVTKSIKILSRSTAYSPQVNLLLTVPGVGLITAMKLLTELETIDRFSSLDKLACYIGLVPSTYSSGARELTRGVTPRGHHVLRSTLIESAWVAIKKDPALMNKYIKLKARMHPNKAIINIAKRLLSRIIYVLRNKKEYKICQVK